MRMGKADNNLFRIAIIIERMDEMACRTEEQLPGDRIRCRTAEHKNKQQQENALLPTKVPHPLVSGCLGLILAIAANILKIQLF